MLAIRFVPHSVHVKTLAGVDAWINQIENTSPESGVQLFEESSGSATDREFVAAKDIQPTLPITTSDLTILSTIGFAGVPVAADGTHPGVICYGRELPLEAVPTAIATANHLQLAISDGLLIPMGIRCSHNAVAKLSLVMHAILGTGGNSGATPFVWSASSAIASGAGATSNIFTTGPLKYNSRLVQGIKDVAIDFGIQILKESDSGDVYPSHVSIIARMTKFEFTTSDVELVTEVGDGVSVTTCAQYFRKVSANGQRVAVGTNQHVSIASTAGMITPGAVHLAHKTAGTAAFTFTPALNTNLITISAAATIPTS